MGTGNKTAKTSQLGARAKDPAQTPSPSSPLPATGNKLKKSGSFRSGDKEEETKVKTGSGAQGETLTSSTKSPKLSRTESMTERTVQKITKVIRGTSRSESRSKKNRDSSLSPKGGASGKEDGSATNKKTEVSTTSKKSTSAAAGGKDDKKSAVEKRKEFQTHKTVS